MKFRKNQKINNLFIAGLMLAASLPALAVTGDTDKPININSIQQSLDMQSNTVTFTGSVVVTQGTIKINADKVVVIRPSGQQGKEVVEAYGNPVTFYQMQDSGKPVSGHSQKLRYELEKDFVILTGNAYLEQLDSNVKGDKITYLVKEQKMEAFSDKGSRVNTVLIPSQLQDKGNSAGKSQTKPAPQKKSN
ncbi:lipopolysaccharide ABC transporter substrate-binding protein LptA [Enterobacillus tribolii]|uniref:Lipopolysaccharide export system protein LptA n=1 Tax=Enterobacillus tribolii TaxID=1487935 RepID=A0A370QRG7_9GAMM|nr:lipopolysaccharide ABC transporter substrate-binding protein LptA [Enterobacillus tribolii]MBW7981638.1 lipopolysaccharide ABC transporter substrate-binding protein LptA [Enterobacillus tribolii]RDK91017.1 lipopolysaccharide export system protein LptA [Enterobacillus tribolii]